MKKLVKLDTVQWVDTDGTTYEGMRQLVITPQQDNSLSEKVKAAYIKVPDYVNHWFLLHYIGSDTYTATIYDKPLLQVKMVK